MVSPVGPNDVRFSLDDAMAKCLRRVQQHRPLTEAEVSLLRYLIMDLAKAIGLEVSFQEHRPSA